MEINNNIIFTGIAGFAIASAVGYYYYKRLHPGHVDPEASKLRLRLLCFE